MSEKEAERREGEATHKSHAIQFFRYWTALDWSLNAVGALAATVAGVTQPLMNIPFGTITTAFSNGDAQAQYVSQTNKNVVYFLYLAVAQFLAIYLYMSLWLTTSERITNRIRKRYLSALLAQDLEFHTTEGAGALVSRIEADLTNIQNGIGEKLPLTIMYIACMFAGFIVAFVRSYKLGLSLSPMLPLMVFVTLMIARYAILYTSKSTKAFTKQSTLTHEAIGAVRTVHSLGAESYFSTRQAASVNEGNRFLCLRARAEALCMAGMTFIIYSGYALAFFYGAILIRDENLEPGIVISVFLSVMMASFAISQVPQNIQSFASAFSSWKSINRIIERRSAIVSPQKGDTVANKEGNTGASVQFDSVSFAYPSRPTERVLQDLSLTVEAGSTVAIVGHSGSSKSTMALLLERFYDPIEGSIKVDGVDLRDYTLRQLRGETISYVNQEPVLLRGTIFENLVAGLGPDATMENSNMPQLRERIEKACKIANAHDFIMQLPQTYFTQVGASGLQLSGGQRARIAIARALVREPRLLILDEATANLDTINESAIFKAIACSDLTCTTLIIAHRPSAITHADRVIVMSRGAVIAQGTYNELTLDNRGGFARMFGQVESETETFVGSGSQTPMEKYSDVEEKEDGALDGDELDAAKEEVAHLPPAKKKSSLKFLLRLLTSRWRRIVLGLIGCLGSGLIFPSFAVSYGQAFNTFTFQRDDVQQANLNALFFFIIAVCGGAAMFAQFYCIGTASTSIIADLRKRLFSTLISKKSISFFDDDVHNSAGSLTNALNTAPDALEKVCGIPMATCISSVLSLSIGCILSLAFNWKFALVNIAALPLTLMTGVCRLKVVDARQGRITKAFEPSVSLVSESVSNIRTVAALAREEHICQEFEKSLHGVDKYVFRMAAVDTSLFALAQTNMFFVIALGFWYGGQLLSRGELTQREFFTIFIAVISGSFQCVNLISQSPELSQAKNGLIMIMRLIQGDDDYVKRKEAEKVVMNNGDQLSTTGGVSLDNVVFTYPNREMMPVLRNVTIKAPERCHIGLCGPSGSGKSSIIALLERFYDPQQGRITLGGTTIDSFPLEEYRKTISLVTQEPVLFSETIMENLLVGLSEEEKKAQISMEAIRDALRDANLLDTIDHLPEGLDTNLGEKGVKLSGGQRQRLVIARALLRKPRILLLDEASSALDWESQQLVQQALHSAMEHSPARITISVAHRLETLKECDCIYVVDTGKVAQQGTYAELLQDQEGTFALMVSAQQNTANIA